MLDLQLAKPGQRLLVARVFVEELRMRRSLGRTTACRGRRKKHDEPDGGYGAQRHRRAA